MDLNDLFDDNRSRDKRRYDERDDANYRERDGRRSQDDPGSGLSPERADLRGDDDHFAFSHIARRLLANKKLLILVGAIAVALLTLVVIFVLPLLRGAVDYVDKNGIKNVVDRVLQGAGGGI
jgi:hypothetical protein